jgi:hypothetical protein
MLTSLAIALVALAVAVSAWLRPPPGDKPAAAPKYTDQQVAEAKMEVCTAYQKVQQALDMAVARNNGDDPTAVLAVATGVRQVLDFGSRYLLAELAETPATPPDLLEAVRKLASSYREATLGLLDGLTNTDAELKPTLSAGDEAMLTVQRLCK